MASNYTTSEIKEAHGFVYIIYTKNSVNQEYPWYFKIFLSECMT